MRIVFLGTPALAVPTLAAMAKRFDVAAVVCQPDRPKGRGRKLAAPPVKEWALEHGLEVHQPAKLNDGTFEAWLKDLAPDLGVVVAYGRLLKQPILDAPRLGYLNLHPSLLPKYRGPSPIFSALWNGDAETAATAMKVVLEMDAGPIILQERTPIGPEETTGTLTARLAELGAPLMVRAAEQVFDGMAQLQEQDPAQVVLCHTVSKEDGHIDWTLDAAILHNRVRACHPWPVAFTSWRGAPLRIHRTAPAEGEGEGRPGEVLAAGPGGIDVAAGLGILRMIEVQLPGKRAMAAGDFLRGHALEPGTVLGD